MTYFVHGHFLFLSLLPNIEQLYQMLPVVMVCFGMVPVVLKWWIGSSKTTSQKKLFLHDGFLPSSWLTPQPRGWVDSEGFCRRLQSPYCSNIDFPPKFQIHSSKLFVLCLLPILEKSWLFSQKTLDLVKRPVTSSFNKANIAMFESRNGIDQAITFLWTSSHLILIKHLLCPFYRGGKQDSKM